MGKQNSNLFTAIDVGSAKTCALVVETTDTGLRYAGHGMIETRGFRKGVIVDLDRTVTSIQKAVQDAEDACGAPIEHAVVGVAGSHIRGVNSQGGITLGNKPREITREDIRLAVERARAIALPADRQILHLLPQEFILDEQAGIHEPAGMVASKLEVKVHVVTAAATATQNVVTALNRAGIHVDDTVFEALACADAVLRSDERELGVCLVDIGAGSTERHRLPRGRGRPHRRGSHRRRPLHQRRGRRPAHPAGRRRKNQAPVRLRRGHAHSGDRTRSRSPASATAPRA